MKKYLKYATIAMLFIACNTCLVRAEQRQTKTKEVSAVEKFILPALPYATDALAPIISAQTISLHHGKHLQTYITNLNKLIVSTKFEDAELDDIVKGSTGSLFNNAAQTWNHIFYFDTFAPESSAAKVPNEELNAAIEKQYGSLDNFKKEFVDAGLSI
ncbi:MAG: superoxide dismutase, partial [Rikenellaceae bacterium]